MLIDLPKIIKNTKRVGRGKASGKGKTSGRGMNGQKSRSGASTEFQTGGQTKYYLRLPKRSGFRNPRSKAVVEITYDKIINEFSKSEKITQEKLVDKFNIEEKFDFIKVIMKGDVKEKRDFGEKVKLSKTIKEISKNA